MLKITLRQLEIFIAIAKAQNINAATESIHLSQAALSMALATLESQLGAQLFDRKGKRLLLNAIGKEMLPQAMAIIDQAKLFETALKNDTQTLHGNIHLGASTTIANYLLPAFIMQFMQDNPQLSITLKVENSSQIIHEVANFKLDLGIIEGRCVHPDISLTPWKKDHLVIVAGRHHPLTKKSRITQKDLQEAQWIMREKGSGTREIFEKAMNTDILPFLELGDTEAIKHAIMTGKAIACLSQLAVAQAVKLKQLVILKTPFLNLSRDLFIISHKKSHTSALFKKLLKELKSINL